MQPPFAARSTNFQRDANNGLTAPSAAGVDSELNAIINVVNQAILRLRGITEADGTLVNFASATAQALAGTQDFTATAAQTAFLTSITWTAAFTSSNVFVFVNNIKLSTAAVTVANSGGFLQVTVTAQAAGAVVTIAAFESGAGLLSRLQTISATDGASLIAINDAGGFFAAVQVEAALQEEATARVALTAAIGNTADLIRRTGTVPFTAAQSMGGFKLTNLANGTAATDAVTVGQMNAYTAVWNALQSYFLRLDGTVPMGGALQMGANKITGLANGTVATDAVNKSQLDLSLKADGTVTSAANQNMGGFKITGLAAGVAATDAVNLSQAQSLVAGFATLVAYQAAGTFAFVVPAGISKLKTEAWGAGGGGKAAVGYPAAGGGGGGYTTAILAVTAGETLTITVGAGGTGGAVPTAGTVSKITRVATDLTTANGGAAGTVATPAGGTFAFDGTVTGFGINGQAGEAGFNDNDGVGHFGAGYGGDAARGGWGGKGYSTGSGGGGSTYANGVAPGGGGGAGDGVGAGSGAAGAVLISY
jgi:hypothetical protein